jgi:hypothetical protein
MVQPVSQSNGSLSGGGVSLGISPLPKAGLDEALSLAIGSWCVRFGAQVSDTQVAAGGVEVLGQVGVTVVGHHPLHADTELSVVLNRGPQSCDSRLGMLVSGDAGRRQARGIIDSDV